MNKLKVFRYEHFIFIALVFFGTFYRISNSELWPITISKTWYSPEQFEFSMLQKPLLSLFLSLFHLLPINDVMHIMIVKIIFAVIGTAGLWAFCKFLVLITDCEQSRIPYTALLMTGVSLISPTILTHFFCVRSDQLASTLFSFFLLFSFQKKLHQSILLSIFIPFTGIKEIFFLAPCLLILYYNFKHLVSKKTILLLFYVFFTILVWLVALNMSAIYYFLETFQQISFNSKLTTYYLEVESLSIFLSVISCIYILINKMKEFKIYAVLSLYFLGVYIFIPQAYSFLVASILPFIYIPLVLIILKTSLSRSLASISIVLCQYVFVFYTQIQNNAFVYTSLFEQISYIGKAAEIIQSNNLSYLDGVGILPRQKHYPCFASPYDQVANSSCLDRILGQQLDSFIISSRLMYVGEQIFQVAEKDYIQILPSFWVNKIKINDEILKSKTENNQLTPAFLLF